MIILIAQGLDYKHHFFIKKFDSEEKAYEIVKSETISEPRSKNHGKSQIFEVKVKYYINNIPYSWYKIIDTDKID